MHSINKNVKIRVVHILEGFSGGIATYICTLLPQLVQQGYEVVLICSLNRGCPEVESRIAKLRANGIEVHIVPMCREISPLKDFCSFIAILKILSKKNFQIIHTHCSKAGALGRLAAAIIGKNIRLHSPHCFAFVRCVNRYQAILYLLLERLLAKFTTRLLAVGESEAIVAIESQIVPEYKCVTICNGLPDNEFLSKRLSMKKRIELKESLNIAKHKRVVSTAGRLVDYKGIFRFLGAARLCRTDNVMFMIAGDGELKTSAERYIMKHNIGMNVRLMGHISDIDRLYAISDLFVLCSDAEAQPYVLLEAMRAGCPVIATSVIGNKDLIQHEQTGVLVEPTAEAIASNIDELLSDHVRLGEYSKNAYKHFRQFHLVERQVSQIAAAYSACL